MNGDKSSSSEAEHATKTVRSCKKMTMRHSSPFVRSALRSRVLAVAAVLFASGLSGCNNAAEGTLSGAALGAGAGAVIGSFFGSAGTGAAVGAVGGALGGGVIGDQNDRRYSYGSGHSNGYSRGHSHVYYHEYSHRPRSWSDYRHCDW